MFFMGPLLKLSYNSMACCKTTLIILYSQLMSITKEINPSLLKHQNKGVQSLEY